MSIPRRLFLFAAICLSTALSAAPETYTVDLAPAWKAGQTYTTSVTASETMRMTVTKGAQKLHEQTQSRNARFEADAQALSVYPNGGLRKAVFTVRSFRISLDGSPEADVLPAGAKIVAENTGPMKITFTIDGRPASTEKETLCKLVISIDDEKHTDQTIFGTLKPVAVGESWQPDSEVLKRTLGKNLGKIGLAQANMRLEAIEGSGPARVAVVSGKVVFQGIEPQMPPGITPKSGRMTVAVDGRIPASRSKSKRVDNISAVANFVGEAVGPDGSIVTATVNADSKQSSVLTFP